LPLYSLQNNSTLLQRNSNITAIEFQQFQQLKAVCAPSRRVESQSDVLFGCIQQRWAVRRSIAGELFEIESHTYQVSNIVTRRSAFMLTAIGVQIM
jgi:hypothetical protein